MLQEIFTFWACSMLEWYNFGLVWAYFESTTNMQCVKMYIAPTGMNYCCLFFHIDSFQRWKRVIAEENLVPYFLFSVADEARNNFNEADEELKKLDKEIRYVVMVYTSNNCPTPDQKRRHTSQGYWFSDGIEKSMPCTVMTKTYTSWASLRILPIKLRHYHHYAILLLLKSFRVIHPL